MFRAASHAGAIVFVSRCDPEALGDAQWYGRLWHVPVRIVESDQAPPPRSVLVASELGCARCRLIEQQVLFSAYMTPGR